MYVNLDPAAKDFDYEPDVDIKDLISLEDVMDEMGLGPNGGLIACFEFLLDNLDWLDEALGEGDEESLVVFCLDQEGFFASPRREASVRALRMTTKAFFPQDVQSVRISVLCEDQNSQADGRHSSQEPVPLTSRLKEDKRNGDRLSWTLHFGAIRTT